MIFNIVIKINTMTGIDYALLVCLLIMINLFFIIGVIFKIQKMAIILFRTNLYDREFNARMFFLVSTFIGIVSVNKVLLTGNTLFDAPTIFGIATFFETLLIILFLVFERGIKKTNS